MVLGQVFSAHLFHDQVLRPGWEFLAGVLAYWPDLTGSLSLPQVGDKMQR